MKIEQMEYLVHFSHSGSIANTSAYFYMTKQGMNKALHQLERDSGYVLFEGGAAGLKLTGAGIEFARNAEAVVQDYHRLRRDMCIYGDRNSVPSGSPVTVFATAAASRYLIPQMGLQNPGVFPFEVLLREEAQKDIAESLSLRSREKVMAIMTFPALSRYEERFRESAVEHELVYDVLGESDVYALVSTSSKFAQLEEFDVEKLLAGQTVGYVYDEMLRDALDDFVRDEDVRTVTSNIDLLDEQIATNRLITFSPTPRLINKRPPAGIVAIPCKNGIRIQYGIARSAATKDDPDILKVVAKAESSFASGVV